MNQDKQPEALWLAYALRDMSSKFDTPSHERGIVNGAIQELRRLHAESEQHLQELRSYRITVENREARIAELEARVQELEAEKARLIEAYAPCPSATEAYMYGITQEKQG